MKTMSANEYLRQVDPMGLITPHINGYYLKFLYNMKVMNGQVTIERTVDLRTGWTVKEKPHRANTRTKALYNPSTNTFIPNYY